MSESAPLRVLVVEDYESDYELLVIHLRRGGVKAESLRVENEAAMRSALAASRWDLVISDYNVPGFGALPALQVRAELAPELPFILMSGAIGEEAAAEAMRLGATDFVPKDHPGRLVPAIRRTLEAVEARRAGRRAEAQLAAIAAHVPGAIFRLRSTRAGEPFALDYLSDGAGPLMGIDVAQCREEPARLLERFEDAPGLRAAIVQAAVEGTALSGEYRLAEGAGARWVHVRASAAAEGDALAWSGVLTDISALKAAEADLIDSEAQLRRLTAHLERAKEEERARIAREVHDELGGMLTAMRLDLAQVPRHELPEAMAARIARVDGLVHDAMKSSQAIARALRPGALDHGLVPALRWQARDFEARHGVEVRFESNDPVVDLPPETATALFRISQEALTNIAKHASARSVELTLFSSAESVSLEIRDDGRGIAPANLDRTGSFGVFGMQERMRHLGGWLEIDGAPGKGTTLMASVPRQARVGGE